MSNLHQHMTPLQLAIDQMRDVYMSDKQRAAYTYILDSLSALEKRVQEQFDVLHALEEIRAKIAGELETFRAFGKDIMKDWQHGDLDGGDRQNIAVKHGMLAEITLQIPCGEHCACLEYADEGDIGRCFWRTSLLTGNPESDHNIQHMRARNVQSL